MELDQDTVVLVSWLREEGDRVVKGEPIMEIETGKTNVAIDAGATGTLIAQLVAEGVEVNVGTVVGLIGPE